MRRVGRKYPLLIYKRMLDLWWPLTLSIGVALFISWWPASKHPVWQAEPWRFIMLLVVVGFLFLATAILLLMGRLAYVRLFGDHLLVATPFLRMKIHYKRIHRTSIAAMHILFPPGKLSSWKREILEPLASRTAIVLELNSLPISRSALQMFLSPFFFKDQSPHILILVKDWMKFSTELDSFRTTGGVAYQKARPPSSILSRLPKKE